jgi:hypothetical protein
MSLDIGRPSGGTQVLGAGACPPPPWGGGVGGGALQPQHLWLTPLPDPPPQGGREQSDHSRTTEEIAR